MTINDFTPKTAAVHYLELALKSGIRGSGRQAIQNAINTINNVKTGISDLHCKRLRYGDKPILDSHTKGLRLQPKKRGNIWTFRYDFDGKQPVLDLGAYPEISLADAREKAHEARQLINNGVNPKLSVIHEFTVREICKKYIDLAESHKKSWQDDMKYLNKNLIPYLGDRIATSITSVDAGEIIDRIIERGALSQADNVRKLCASVFNVALGLGKGRKWLASTSSRIDPWIQMTENPFNRVVVPATKPDVCTLQGQALISYLTNLKSSGISQEIVTVLTLQLLTVTRISEVSQMSWEELDLDGGVWTLPPERAKNKQEHRMLLSTQAIDLLRSLTPGDGFIFAFNAMARDSIMSTISKDIREHREILGVPKNFTSHSLRHTGGTLLASMGCNDNIQARVENHVKGANDMQAKYNAHRYDEEAKMWWQKLADKLDDLTKR